MNKQKIYELADTLEAGVSADIWNDANDDVTHERITATQVAMKRAARLLRNVADTVYGGEEV